MQDVILFLNLFGMISFAMAIFFMAFSKSGASQIYSLSFTISAGHATPGVDLETSKPIVFIAPSLLNCISFYYSRNAAQAFDPKRVQNHFVSGLVNKKTLLTSNRSHKCRSPHGLTKEISQINVVFLIVNKFSCSIFDMHFT